MKMRVIIFHVDCAQFADDIGRPVSRAPLRVMFPGRPGGKKNGPTRAPAPLRKRLSVFQIGGDRMKPEPFATLPANK